MLSGFNTNVRHKGIVFHVQTEDSGRQHPHVITHLFHGGNILASEKRSYEHLLQEDGELEVQVKQLMEEQHSTMVENLKSGALNAVIRERLGSGGGAAGAPAPAAEPTPIQKVAAEQIEKPTRKPKSASPKPASTPAEPPAAESDPAPAEDGHRPLDEVVLDYLLESARQRSKR